MKHIEKEKGDERAGSGGWGLNLCGGVGVSKSSRKSYLEQARKGGQINGGMISVDPRDQLVEEMANRKLDFYLDEEPREIEKTSFHSGIRGIEKRRIPIGGRSVGISKRRKGTQPPETRGWRRL